MNKHQRKQLTSALNAASLLTNGDFVESLSAESLREKVDAVQSDLQSIADEERDKYDNLPEGLQQAATGENLESTADALE